jgi:hypothetical protein
LPSLIPPTKAIRCWLLHVRSSHRYGCSCRDHRATQPTTDSANQSR